MEQINVVADMIVNSNRIVVFTGAGFSTESDVPDFRGPQGVWQMFDPSELNLQNFLRSEEIRDKYWQVHKLFWETVREAEPNSGHYAVTKLHIWGTIGTQMDHIEILGREDVDIISCARSSVDRAAVPDAIQVDFLIK